MEKKTERKAVGRRIKELRIRNNETQKMLADIINSTPNSISKLENGDMGLTFENMLLIAEHYKVSLDYLCKGEGGSSLLDTLNTYINLSFHDFSNLTPDNTVYPLPILSINKAFFEYLLQTANANADKHIPAQLRKQWIDIETQNFTKSIIHDTHKDFISVIPVRKSFVNNNYDLHIAISNSKLM